MAFREDDKAARLEGYEPLDLHESGNLCFALKSHGVGEDEVGCSPAEVVEQVMQSPRLQKTVLEVFNNASDQCVCMCAQCLAVSLHGVCVVCVCWLMYIAL